MQAVYCMPALSTNIVRHIKERERTDDQMN